MQAPVVGASSLSAAGAAAALREKLRSHLLRGCVYVLLGAACVVIYKLLNPVRYQLNRTRELTALSDDAL